MSTNPHVMSKYATEIDCLRARDKWHQQRIVELERENAVLQARIDELMLEHCPDEMSAEQIDNYAKHQCPVSAEEEAAVNAAIAKIKEAL